MFAILVGVIEEICGETSMGWKGTMRSVSAAARRLEKEAERRHKQAIKTQVAADSAEAVEAWVSYIESLHTVHTNLAEGVDWRGMLKQLNPQEPIKRTRNADRAHSQLAAFRPSVLDFLRGGAAKRRAPLEAALAEALVKDEADYQEAARSHRAALQDWAADSSLAARLLEGESSAIQEVVREMKSLSKNHLIGSAINFTIEDSYVHARPQVRSDEIVPKFRRKMLTSGKLSETKMPVGAFNELYQDYVASVALKVAGDLFRMLPLEEVFVTCEADMLNSANGYKERTPILSVHFVRSTMFALNMKSLDPSDAMANFNHAMKFSRTKGFAQIDPLRIDPVS